MSPRWIAQRSTPMSRPSRGRSITSGRAIPWPRRSSSVLGELEGGHALLFGSGSAATAALALALLEPGARVAVADGGYWGTVGLLRGELGRWGLHVVSFDQTRRAARGRPRLARALLEPDAHLPRPRRGDRHRSRRGGKGRGRQHRPQSGSPAPARARRRLRRAQRDQDHRRPPRRAPRSGHMRRRKTTTHASTPSAPRPGSPPRPTPPGSPSVG